MGPVQRKICFAAAQFAAGQGGIARVARMTAHVLEDRYGGVDFLSLLDRDPETIAGSVAVTARANKLAFIMRCQAAAWRCSHFLFDSAGLARARPGLPFTRRPYAVWMHGIEVWDELKPGAGRALKAADLLLVNSRFTLDRFQRLHGEHPQARICWLGTEDDLPPPRRPDKSGPPSVLMLSRINQGEAYKGHAEMVASWPGVVAAVPDAKLVIAGGGSGLGALRALVSASPAASSIACLGFVPEHEITALWQNATVFAMPSRKEGFGIVYAEAMRYALPIIGSVHDAASEVNIHGKTGLNINLDHDGELLAAMIELLQSPVLARSMGEAGFKLWRQQFCYSAFERRLVGALTGFLGGST
jgi:phosphatidylinositol alpha-1,6-mannosyltransferase